MCFQPAEKEINKEILKPFGLETSSHFHYCITALSNYYKFVVYSITAHECMQSTEIYLKSGYYHFSSSAVKHLSSVMARAHR